MSIAHLANISPIPGHPNNITIDPRKSHRATTVSGLHAFFTKILVELGCIFKDLVCPLMWACREHKLGAPGSNSASTRRWVLQ